MLFGWDFKYTNRNEKEQETRTAQFLINEVSYFIPMHTLIDDRSMKDNPQINGLFLPTRTHVESRSTALTIFPHKHELESTEGSSRRQGKINRLKEGYGFVTDSVDGKSRFFHHTSLLEEDFNNLHEDDQVEFEAVEDGKSGKAINIAMIKK